jgi:WD40 repeat protein/serine/threonine protein kinase
MTEREIFLGALEQEGPAARAAYLDAACAGRPALRQRVEELLRSHQEADTFLNVPAVEQLVAAEASLAFLGPSREGDALGRLDHYEVLEVVGRGGTGVVLRARDTKLLRVVAIKTLAPRLAASATARQRFVREAQAAAAVRDDHVIAIHAVSDDGLVPYLVMEYIDGITLEERLEQAGALGLTEVLRVGMQLAQGLAAAHAQGVIHRDIKPANILLENGVHRVKITDFGLAWVADEANLTNGKVLAGTPRYMSPEQARGEPADYRTDLFSLGSLLYTLCAGRPPFRADTTAAVLKCVCDDTPTPLREINPDVPGWLCDLISKLHAKEPGDRLASARQAAELLSEQLALLQQPPRQAPSRASAPPPRWKRLMVLCAAGLLIALAVLAILLKPWQRFAREHRSGNETPDEGQHPAGLLELRREDIPPRLLALAGGGDPAQAPRELAAVLGDGRFLLPHVGGTAWMDQSPDGKVLAVPLDEEVALFDVSTGNYLRSLKGPGGRVVWVTFSHDSQLLAVTTWYEGRDGALRVFDVRAASELFTRRLPGPKISGVTAFSPDGRSLVTEGMERIQVCDARTGKETHTVPHQPGGCAALCFSPDGRRLAASHWWGHQVRVFDWDGEKLEEVGTLSHPGPVGHVVYSPNGKLLASGDGEGFKLWNAETLGEIRTVRTPAQQLAFSPDSRSLFAATTTDRDKAVHTITRWDVGTLKQLPGLSVAALAERGRPHHRLSCDGKVLFVVPGHKATYVQVIDTATGKERFPRQGHVAPLHAVAVSPDGRRLASGGQDRAVKVWDLASRRVLHSFTMHHDAVWGLAFNPDGQLLASGSCDSTIALWDLRSGTEVRALHGHSREPSRIQFSPDGRTLAAGGEGGIIKKWDVATGKEGRPLPGHTGAVRCVAFSRDGQWLASGGEDRTVLLHHLAEGRSRMFQAMKPVNEVAFSADGRTLAAACDGPEAAVHLWDLETGKETTWKGHTGHLHGLAFSPGASLLATSGEDGTVRLWDRSGGTPHVWTIGPGPFGGAVRAVAFTPEGRYLATANANGTVYLLRVRGPRTPQAAPAVKSK